MDQKIYQQNRAVIFSKEKDEGVIYNPETSEILILNQTGCFVWALCNDKNSKEDIARAVLDNFEADYETVIKDLTVFLSTLEKKKFL